MNKECIICKRELQGSQQKYCSNNCKQKGHWDRVSEQPNTYHSQTIRGYKRKIALIDMSGGHCIKCGYSKNIASLQFHHRNSSTKSFELDARILSNKRWELIVHEFEKCDLLCANCHIEHHNPEMEISNVRKITLKNREHLIVIPKGKPECLDCGIKISYSCERCKKCSSKFRQKVERPDLIILEKEKLENGTLWCAEKYGVSSKTIRKWIKKQIQ